MGKNKEDYMADVDLDRYEEELNTWIISFSDLIKMDCYKKYFKDNPMNCEGLQVTDKHHISIKYPRPSDVELARMLYGLGMDIHQPVESQINQHRNSQGDVVCTERWVGRKRQDERWLKFERMSKV